MVAEGVIDTNAGFSGSITKTYEGGRLLSVQVKDNAPPIVRVPSQQEASGVARDQQTMRLRGNREMKNAKVSF